MLPSINEEEARLLHYWQDAILPVELEEIFGGKMGYYRLKKTVEEKYKVYSKLYINYKKLGLDNYIILSKLLYNSPYLVQFFPYYVTPTPTYFSRFCIPSKYEQQFINQVKKLDPDAEIYQALEMRMPNYNFNIIPDSTKDEHKFYRWMALILEGKIRELELPSFDGFKFDLKMLQILHHVVKELDTDQGVRGLPRIQVIDELGFTESVFDLRINKMKGILYHETITVDSIRKLIFKINKPPEKLDFGLLISSFCDLFIYCHPFLIEKKYPEHKVQNHESILCIISPPTPNIPYFHHAIDSFLKVNSFLTLIGNTIDIFNLDQIYNEIQKDWVWNDQTVQIVK